MRNLGRRLESHMGEVAQRFNSGVDKLAKDLEKESAEIIKEHVKTTPSGLTPGKDNRIWTGAMHDNAQAKSRKTGSGYDIEYGWFGFKNGGDYVKDQELGGGDVAFGMHSFSAVLENARDRLHDFQRGKYFDN